MANSWDRVVKAVTKRGPRCDNYDKIATAYAKCSRRVLTTRGDGTRCEPASERLLARAVSNAFTGQCKRAHKLYIRAGFSDQKPASRSPDFEGRTERQSRIEDMRYEFEKKKLTRR